MKTIISLLFIALLLGGCTLPTRYERKPNKIGFNPNDLKKSHCACYDVFLAPYGVEDL